LGDEYWNTNILQASIIRYRELLAIWNYRIDDIDTVIYLGQIYLRQIYLGQIYLRQIYLGQIYLRQIYLGQIIIILDQLVKLTIECKVVLSLDTLLPKT